MYYYKIKYVSWQNPNIEYGYSYGLYANKADAEAKAESWNETHWMVDDRRAVVVVV